MVLQDRAWRAVAVWDPPTCYAMTEVGQSIPEERPSVSKTAPENMQQGWKWLAKRCGAVHSCEVRAAVELMACRLLFHPPFLSKPTKRITRLLDYGMHGMVAASGPPQSPFHVPERAGRRGILWPRNVLDEFFRPGQQAGCVSWPVACLLLRLGCRIFFILFVSGCLQLREARQPRGLPNTYLPFWIFGLWIYIAGTRWSIEPAEGGP